MLSSFFDYNYSDDLLPVERRWKLRNSKSFFHLFPEFKNIGEEKILAEDSIADGERYILEKKYFSTMASEIISDDFNMSVLRDNQQKPEYFFVLNLRHNGKIIYSYEEPLKFFYAGFHWTNEEGFLYTLLKNKGKNSFDPDFKLDCRKYQHTKEEIVLEGKFVYDDVEKGLNVFFTAFYKDLRRWNVRYTITYLNDVRKHGGVSLLFPFFEKYFNHDDMLKISDLWEDKISQLGLSPPADSLMPVHSVLNFSPEVEKMINKDDEVVVDMNRNVGGGIHCFKMVYDDTPDYIRMNPHPSPYKDGAIYDPPLRRGVTKIQQPYRFLIANSVIDMEDLNGDTPNMRKIVTQDTLTRALDLAASRGFPLPPLGTEFYLHLGDSAPQGAIDLKQPIAVYARLNRHKEFLFPFPDYSYQIFSISTRFHIRASSSMTFDAVKNYINESPTTTDKEDKIFFRGNDFSHSKIRKFLYQIQEKDFLGKRKNEILIPKGVLKIDIPKFSEGKELPPITIPEMGKYKFLLDLPGYGMWSTRLKFIALTKSHIARIIFLEKTYDKVKKEWKSVDVDNDLWETFTDSFLPISKTHTIISDYYSPGSGVDGKEVEDLNYKSRLEVVRQIGQLRQDILKNPKKYEIKAEEIYKTVMDVSDDDVSQYVYQMIMVMGGYYGFVSDNTKKEMEQKIREDIAFRAEIRPKSPLSQHEQSHMVDSKDHEDNTAPCARSAPLGSRTLSKSPRQVSPIDHHQKAFSHNSKLHLPSKSFIVSSRLATRLRKPSYSDDSDASSTGPSTETVDLRIHKRSQSSDSNGSRASVVKLLAPNTARPKNSLRQKIMSSGSDESEDSFVKPSTKTASNRRRSQSFDSEESNASSVRPRTSPKTAGSKTVATSPKTRTASQKTPSSKTAAISPRATSPALQKRYQSSNSEESDASSVQPRANLHLFSARVERSGSSKNKQFTDPKVSKNQKTRTRN